MGLKGALDMGNVDESQLAEAIKSCWSGIVHLQQENENRQKELASWIRSQEGLFNLIRCLALETGNLP